MLLPVEAPTGRAALTAAWLDLGRLAARFGPYLKGHRGTLAAVLAGSLGGAALGLVPPWIARRLVDEVFVAHHAERLWPLVSLGFAVSVMAMALRGGTSWLYTRATTRLLARVREDLLSHVLAVPLPLRPGLRTGDLLSRLNNDVAEAQRVLTDLGLQLTLALMQLLGAGALLLVLDWRLALATVAVAPVLGAVWLLFAPRNLEIARELRALAGEAMGLLGETLQGASFLQAHDLQGEAVGRYHAWNRRFEAAVLRQQQWGGLAGALPGLVMGVDALLILGWGGSRVAAGQLTLGALLAFTAYQWRFLRPMGGFVGMGLRLQRARAALERVEAIWALPVPAQPPEAELPAGSPGLVLTDLRFSYPGRAALQGLTASIPAGQVTAIVGPTGGGKSTLLWALAGLLPGLTGTIAVGGVPLVPGPRWRARLALVAQDGVFFHGGIAENLRMLAPEADDEQLLAALAAAGLELGLDTTIGERGLALSGGQRQRLGVARALLRDPDLLLLDEPTSALDADTEEAVWAGVVAPRAGRTTVIVTHRATLARRADHVIVVRQGQVVQEGPPGTVEL